MRIFAFGLLAWAFMVLTVIGAHKFSLMEFNHQERASETLVCNAGMVYYFHRDHFWAPAPEFYDRGCVGEVDMAKRLKTPTR